MECPDRFVFTGIAEVDNLPCPKAMRRRAEIVDGEVVAPDEAVELLARRSIVLPELTAARRLQLYELAYEDYTFYHEASQMLSVPFNMFKSTHPNTMEDACGGSSPHLKIVANSAIRGVERGLGRFGMELMKM